MRRPGHEGVVWFRCEGRAEVGLTSRLRAREATKSPGRRRRLRELHTSRRLQALSCAFRAWMEGRKACCKLCSRHSNHKACIVVVTVGQHARKGGLPTVSVTSRDIGDGSVPLP